MVTTTKIDMEYTHKKMKKELKFSLQNINYEFSKGAGYALIKQKSVVFLYTNNEQP